MTFFRFKKKFLLLSIEGCLWYYQVGYLGIKNRKFPLLIKYETNKQNTM